MTKVYIFGIVICKLSYCQGPSPIVLFKVDKNLKIGLYNTFLLLYLAISLRIKND